MGYSFKDLAEDVLKMTNRAMTPVDIWEEGVRLNIAQKVESAGKTPWQSVGAQIYTDIKLNGVNSRFKKVKKGYFIINSFSGKVDDSIFDFEAIKEPVSSYKEKDLHKLLVTFVANADNFHCFCKTIDEKHSSKGCKGEREWLHPDIVGVYYAKEDYDDKVIDLMGRFGNSGTKLFSFELKQDLDMSTLRQKYFQAVSNSSWANEGYLVVLKIAEDESFRRELKRLCNAFGIGVIKLVPENINQSEVIYPAMGRESMDWDTLNILYDANSDFRSFIEDVITSIDRKKRYGVYDTTFDDEEQARQYAREKGMIK